MYLDQVKYRKLYQYIKETDTIIIHRHVRPDPDAIGSQLGLKYLIKEKFPEKNILAAGSMSKGLTWMGQMDAINKEEYKDALVIVVDTANHPRIDDKRYDQGKFLIKIDHHPEVDPYGDFNIVHSQASSCSEIIANIALSLGEDLPLNQQASQLLYAGIVGDTGRFLYDSTSSLTFQTAAKLLDQGVNPFEINNRFTTITIQQAKFQAYVLDNLILKDSGFAYSIISQDDLNKFSITEEESNAVIGLPGTIEGVKTWALFIEQDTDRPFWRVRLRSKNIIINELAAKYHGGGHAKASGASVYSVEEKNQLIEDMDALTKDD
ncbi:bifunctional oligoribonuclease/PAP phosphatase NrnA [Aerococcaceae bacterium WGS1372]